VVCTRHRRRTRCLHRASRRSRTKTPRAPVRGDDLRPQRRDAQREATERAAARRTPERLQELSGGCVEEKRRAAPLHLRRADQDRAADLVEGAAEVVALLRLWILEHAQQGTVGGLAERRADRVAARLVDGRADEKDIAERTQGETEDDAVIEPRIHGAQQRAGIDVVDVVDTGERMIPNRPVRRADEQLVACDRYRLAEVGAEPVRRRPITDSGRFRSTIVCLRWAVRSRRRVDGAG